MYKIVQPVDLNVASKFIESDKLIKITEDRSQMLVTENDYAHKNQTYLSSCVDIAESSLNSYTETINSLTSTYITSTLNKVYMKNGSLIDISTYNYLMTSDAFLTKEGCKKLETDCINYISEIKNRAMSTLMAKMNSVFISQNSVGRIAFGQVKKLDNQKKVTSYRQYDYDSLIGYEQFKEKVGQDEDFNFNGFGEFSLANLLVNVTPSAPESVDDYWFWAYDEANKTTFKTYAAVEYLINDLEKDKDISSIVAFNCKSNSTSSLDVCINVPQASYDFKRNKSIPIAQMVEYYLKKQIKVSIKKVCDRYLAKMASIPK